MAESPFRDPEISNRHRAEREAEEARVLEEERAAAERRARTAAAEAEKTKSRQRKLTFAGSLGLVASLIALLGRSASSGRPIVRPVTPTASDAAAQASWSSRRGGGATSRSTGRSRSVAACELRGRTVDRRAKESRRRRSRSASRRRSGRGTSATCRHPRRRSGGGSRSVGTSAEQRLQPGVSFWDIF